MKHSYSKELDRVKLVPLKVEDIEELRTLRNRAENRRWFLNSDEISEESQRRWFHQYLCKDNDIMFAVKIKDNDRFIGAAALYNINPQEKEAEFGRIIIDHSNLEGRGWGQEVLNGIIRFAFEDLGLKAIYLEVLIKNDRAIALYKKMGFETIGERDDLLLMKLKNKLLY